MSKGILEIETPESCKECNLWHYCLNYLNITIFANNKNPDCPLKILDSCKDASRDVDGKCLGYQKSKIDDEPTDECMNCKEYQSYEDFKQEED